MLKPMLAGRVDSYRSLEPAEEKSDLVNRAGNPRKSVSTRSLGISFRLFQLSAEQIVGNVTIERSHNRQP